METITIDKEIFADIAKLASEIEDRIESIELMNNKEFMESLKKSDEQIKNREFLPMTKTHQGGRSWPWQSFLKYFRGFLGSL